MRSPSLCKLILPVPPTIWCQRRDGEGGIFIHLAEPGAGIPWGVKLQLPGEANRLLPPGY